VILLPWSLAKISTRPFLHTTRSLRKTASRVPRPQACLATRGIHISRDASVKTHCHTPTQEYVVPRSMPMHGPTIFDFFSLSPPPRGNRSYEASHKEPVRTRVPRNVPAGAFAPIWWRRGVAPPVGVAASSAPAAPRRRGRGRTPEAPASRPSSTFAESASTLLKAPRPQ
jgi:hypothetical protein